MIFTIYRSFLEFFWIYLDFFSIFKLFKIIKKMQKVCIYSRKYTWMRRGTQGHMAAPCGPARVPAWHWGCVAWRGASDKQRNEDRASMRWTRGPPNLDQRTWLKTHLSELIWAVDRANYNSWDLSRSMDLSRHHDRLIKIQRAIESDAPPSSCDEIASRPFIHDRTVIKQKYRFAKRRLIATVDRKVSVRSTVTPNFIFK